MNTPQESSQVSSHQQSPPKEPQVSQETSRRQSDQKIPQNISLSPPISIRVITSEEIWREDRAKAAAKRKAWAKPFGKRSKKPARAPTTVRGISLPKKASSSQTLCSGAGPSSHTGRIIAKGTINLPAAATPSTSSSSTTTSAESSLKLPRPTHRPRTSITPTPSIGQVALSLFREHQSSESKLLVASAPLRSEDLGRCGDMKDTSTTRQPDSNETIRILADVAVNVALPLGDDRLGPSTSHEVEVESHSAERLLTGNLPGSDSDIEEIYIEQVPRPSTTPFVAPQSKRCDHHRENHRGNCGYKDKSNKMCYTHSQCRSNKVPVFDLETLFIACSWCIDWFLFNTYEHDKARHDELQQLIATCRKGEVKKSLDNLKALQSLLVHHATELYKKNRTLEVLDKNHNLSLFIANMHLVQGQANQEAKELRRNHAQLNSWALEMEEHIMYSWDSQVVQCFEGICKFFHATQRYDASSPIHTVYNWLKSKDAQVAQNQDNRRLTTFKTSGCTFFDRLPGNDVIHLLYDDWIFGGGFSKGEQARVSRKRFADAARSSYGLSPFHFMTFSRIVNAHFGDQEFVMKRLIKITAIDPNDSKYVERRLLLIYDELSDYGFRGLLEVIAKEAPPRFQDFLAPFINFPMINRLLDSKVFISERGVSLQEMMDRVRKMYFDTIEA